MAAKLTLEGKIVSGEVRLDVHPAMSARDRDRALDAELSAPPPVEVEQRPMRRFAAVLGLGGVIDVAGKNYPPTQASVIFGFEYRMLDRGSVALDFMARIPVEVAQGWTNVGLMPGLRLVLIPSAKVPLEIVPSLGVGLGLLELSKNRPTIGTSPQPCNNGATPDCLLPALRIHPSINLVYHFHPDWELRGELFGLTADISSPMPDPRISFSLSGAWRFHYPVRFRGCESG